MLREHDSPADVTRVLVVGDVRLHREGLAALISGDARLAVALVASTAEWRSTDVPFDVAVIDVSNVEPDELRDLADAARRPVVAVAVPDDERCVIAFAESGVVGFVEREGSVDELVSSIVSAARGEASFSPPIATTLLRMIVVPPVRTDSPDIAALTVRERQIVQIIGEGLTNKEIAARLSIEVATVKNHVHNILEKLQVSRRSDAVARLRLVETAGVGASEPDRSRIRSTVA